MGDWLGQIRYKVSQRLFDLLVVFGVVGTTAKATRGGWGMVVTYSSLSHKATTWLNFTPSLRGGKKYKEREGAIEKSHYAY